MNTRGTFSVARKLLKHPFLSEDRAFTKFEAFFWLISQAEPKAVLLKDEKDLLELLPGDLRTSFTELADVWHWQIERVQNYLSTILPGVGVEMSLKIEGERVTISLLNYTKYQTPPVLLSQGDFLDSQIKRRKKHTDPRIHSFIAFCRNSVLARGKHLFPNYGVDGGALKRVLKITTEKSLRELWLIYVSQDDPYVKKHGFSIAHFCSAAILSGLTQIHQAQARERANQLLRKQSGESSQAAACSRMAENFEEDVILANVLPDGQVPPNDVDDRHYYCDGLGNLYYLVQTRQATPERIYSSLSCPECSKYDRP